MVVSLTYSYLANGSELKQTVKFTVEKIDKNFTNEVLKVGDQFECELTLDQETTEVKLQKVCGPRNGQTSLFEIPKNEDYLKSTSI